MRTNLTILATAFTLAICVAPAFADNQGTHKGNTNRGTTATDPCLNPNRGPNTMDAHGKPCPSMNQGNTHGGNTGGTMGGDSPRGRLGTGGVIDDVNSATGGTGGSTTDSTTGTTGGHGTTGSDTHGGKGSTHGTTGSGHGTTGGGSH